MRRGEEVQRVYQTFDSLELFSTAAAIAIGRFGQGIGSMEGNVKEVSGSPQNPIQHSHQRAAHLLGRDDDLAAIGAALNSKHGRAAITGLHGLRGVGKTALAAAYAERHRRDYRAT
jgi:hypothetical protein